MRDLGARVGMRAQSLYSYFESKDAIYDAMFRQGYEEFLDWMSPVLDDPARDPVATVTAGSRRFFDFCVADPVRHQLLFQRTIPGFVPSAESYAVAVDALERSGRVIRAAGIEDSAGLDLWTAVMTGLTNQQIANDPGGDRWSRLVERAVRMLLLELAPHLLDHSPAPGHDRSTT
jgi:AcrR family transcriptional regulator